MTKWKMTKKIIIKKDVMRIGAGLVAANGHKQGDKRQGARD